MLRRRILLSIQGSYRWARSVIRTVIGRKASPIAAPSVEVEARKSSRTGTASIADKWPTEDTNTSVSIRTGRIANPSPNTSIQTHSLRGIRTSRLSMAMANRLVLGNSHRRIVMGRFTNPVLANSNVANGARKIHTGVTSIAESGSATESETYRGFTVGISNVGRAGDSIEVESNRRSVLRRSVDPVNATTLVGERFSGIQNGVSNEAALEFENYMTGDMLVLRQVYYAEVIDGVLEVS